MTSAALYTKIFDDKRRDWFFQTRFCKRPKELLALARKLSTSLATVASLKMAVPWYVKCSTVCSTEHVLSVTFNRRKMSTITERIVEDKESYNPTPPSPPPLFRSKANGEYKLRLAEKAPAPRPFHSYLAFFF